MKAEDKEMGDDAASGNGALRNSKEIQYMSSFGWKNLYHIYK